MGFELDGIGFRPDTLDGFPEHAALLGQIVTSFSLIEGAIGGIYGLLRNEDIDSAIEDLKKLSTNAKRVESVRKIMDGDAALSADPANDELMKAILKYAEKRNAIAHGIWGCRVGATDVVYRLPVKKWINYVATIVASGTDGTALARVDELRAELEEYGVADLRSLLSQGEQLLESALRLFTALAAGAARSDGWTEG